MRKRFRNAVHSDERWYSKARVFGRSNNGESKVGNPQEKDRITGNGIILLCKTVYLKPESEEEAVRMIQDVIKGIAETYPQKVFRSDSSRAGLSCDPRCGSVCNKIRAHETPSREILGVCSAGMYDCDSKLLTDSEADTQREI